MRFLLSAVVLCLLAACALAGSDSCDYKNCYKVSSTDRLWSIALELPCPP